LGSARWEQTSENGAKGKKTRRRPALWVLAVKLPWNPTFFRRILALNL
jgi:hypothetical protein